MRLPPPLKRGSRVALVAPSGPLRNDADLQRAIANTRSLGWDPVVGEHVLERDAYLAGSDDSRRADLNEFVADESIDAIWCIRGGYGSMRLLNALDYTAWREHPKALIGYSDITALHAAIGPRADLVTYHGPTARSELTEFSKASLAAAVGESRGPIMLAASDADVLHSGSATGRLAGGNLAVLSALTGTPFAPHLDDTILVLEDVNESVYRLDRMFTQLRLSGALDRVAGIAFGHFTDIPPDESGESRPLDDLLCEVADRCRVPCVARIPVGHIDDQWTIPFGRTAVLDADSKTLKIR
jgi:muramoyltetrapeptide carboxypeptidase